MKDVDGGDVARAWLSGLTERQFAEFLVQVTAERSTAEYEGETGHFVLADARLDPETGRWDIDFIGLPENPESWDGEVPISQSAVCSACNYPVRSWAKRLVCPICATPTYAS